MTPEDNFTDTELQALLDKVKDISWEENRKLTKNQYLDIFSRFLKRVFELEPEVFAVQWEQGYDVWDDCSYTLGVEQVYFFGQEQIDYCKNLGLPTEGEEFFNTSFPVEVGAKYINEEVYIDKFLNESTYHLEKILGVNATIRVFKDGKLVILKKEE